MDDLRLRELMDEAAASETHEKRAVRWLIAIAHSPAWRPSAELIDMAQRGLAEVRAYQREEAQCRS